MEISLLEAKRKAVKGKWHRWIRNCNDEFALTEGCYFDQRKADHVCNFIEQHLRHAKGEFAGQPIELAEWQRDFLSRLFGWQREDGNRRFKFCGCWLSKKNGKSFLASAIGLYMLIAEGRIGAEVISLANSAKQAGHVFDNASRMLKSSPQLSRLLRRGDILETKSKSIIALPERNSRFQVVAASHSTSEGYDQSCCIYDEIHKAKDDRLFNAVRWGGIAQKSSLLLTISTAGVFDPEHIAWRQWQLAKQIESDERIDTSFLPIIYAADEEDDYSKVETWKKANPMLGITLDVDEFRKDYEQVKDSVSDFNEWLRYRLNIWTQSVTSWIPDSKWQSAVAPCSAEQAKTQNWFALSSDEIKSRKWYAGLDLASTKDISALVLLSDQGEALPFYWVCSAQIKERQKREDNQYSAWAKHGYINEIDGEAIDYDFIFEHIIKLRETFNIQSVAVDRWAATQIVQKLEGENFTIHYHGQGFRDMSAPTKELERLVLTQSIKLPACPVLRWMARNASVELDAAGNVKLSKKKSKDKIDGLIALVQAITLKLIADAPKKKSMYESRGIRAL